MAEVSTVPGDTAANEQDTWRRLSEPQEQPLLTENVISMFGLDNITASVRRTDPETGKTTNVRKSYKNYLKQLDIAGNPEPDSTKGVIMNGGLLHTDEVEWQKKHEAQNPVLKIMAQDIFSKLDIAVQMAPGDLPPEEDKKWKKLIGKKKPETTRLQSQLPNRDQSIASSNRASAGVENQAKNRKRKAVATPRPQPLNLAKRPRCK